MVRVTRYIPLRRMNQLRKCETPRVKAPNHRSITASTSGRRHMPLNGRRVGGQESLSGHTWIDERNVRGYQALTIFCFAPRGAWKVSFVLYETHPWV